MKDEKWIKEKINTIQHDPDWIDLKCSHILLPIPKQRRLQLFGDPKTEEYYLEKNREIVNSRIDWSLIRL